MRDVQHLGHIELLNQRAKPVPFCELWKEEKTVIGFLRQFGCIFCHQQAAELLDAQSEIEARGGQIALIGNGNPAHASEFRTRLGLEGDVYTDPARMLYDALNMEHGVRKTLNFKSRQHYKDAKQLGFRQVGTRGHRWQQGGCLVVDATGKVLYAFCSAVAGEHAPIRDILRALR